MYKIFFFLVFMLCDDIDDDERDFRVIKKVIKSSAC